MAKIAFSKLNKIKSSEPVICKVGEEEITVQTYLPVEDKLSLIATIIESAGDNEQGFYNIVKLEVFYILEMLRTYTNINFTEKMLENPTKLYDGIQLNHIWDIISQYIPEKERNYIWDNTLSIAREVTNYNHSALGILKSMATDYNNLDLDATNIQEKLANPENLSLLKDILAKLG